MIAKFFTWRHPAPITPLQQRLDLVWTGGMVTGVFIALAGFAVALLSGLNKPLLPALVLLAFSGVAIVILTWRIARIRNRLAGRLVALLDAEERGNHGD